jgi:ParB family chromosome partitioning protein
MAKQVVRVGAKQLGSGIDALFSAKMDEAIRENPVEVVRELSHTFAMIPIGEIEANPDQPRKEFDSDALEELAASIRVHGLIQPITVRRLSASEYQLISGERRWRASKLSGLTEVPAYIRIANDQEMLEMALIENIQREDLNAIEVAITYHRLKEECNLTDERLADRVGKKRSTITNYLRLLDLHIEVIEAIRRNELSMGHARAIASIEDKLLQKEALAEVLSRGMSVRDTEKLVKAYSGKSLKKAPAEKSIPGKLPSDYEDILADFRAFFGSGRIQIKLDEDGKGQILIPFDTADQLTEFYRCVEQ